MDLDKEGYLVTRAFTKPKGNVMEKNNAIENLSKTIKNKNH